MVEVTRFDRCSPKISNFLNNQEATVISDQTFNPLAAAIHHVPSFSVSVLKELYQWTTHSKLSIICGLGAVALYRQSLTSFAESCKDQLLTGYINMRLQIKTFWFFRATFLAMFKKIVTRQNFKKLSFLKQSSNVDE